MKREVMKIKKMVGMILMASLVLVAIPITSTNDEVMVCGDRPMIELND